MADGEKNPQGPPQANNQNGHDVLKALDVANTKSV